MEEHRGWFRKLWDRLAGGFRRFMEGRYGTDRLTLVILCLGTLLSLVGMLVQIYGSWSPAWNVVFTLISYALMVWAIFRTLSRNTYRRYRENQRFHQILEMITDRKNRHFQCPKCKEIVLVPRGKGKITITCPKCGEKFLRKT